jgi:hypothetical protein
MAPPSFPLQRVLALAPVEQNVHLHVPESEASVDRLGQRARLQPSQVGAVLNPARTACAETAAP